MATKKNAKVAADKKVAELENMLAAAKAEQQKIEAEEKKQAEAKAKKQAAAKKRAALKADKFSLANAIPDKLMELINELSDDENMTPAEFINFLVADYCDENDDYYEDDDYEDEDDLGVLISLAGKTVQQQVEQFEAARRK